MRRGAVSPANPGVSTSPAPLGTEVRQNVIQAFLEHRTGAMGAIFLMLTAAFSWIGPEIYASSPTDVDVGKALSPPGSGHPLGTDQIGRDVLARLMEGGQASLSIGLAAAVVATGLGVSYGVVAGFYGKWVDLVLMRLVDILMAIPALFFVLLLAVIFQPSLVLFIIVVAMGAWLIPARLVRAETISLMARQFVIASRGMGASRRRLIFRHLLPNAVGTIVVNLTFQVADAILLIASLSFLGFGIPPPTPSWGGMLSDSQSYIFQNAWWLIYPAGGFILVTVVSVNLVGDALRDAFEARLRS